MVKSTIILGSVGLLLEIWLLVAMRKRGIFRAFPFFSTYIFSSAVISGLKLAVVHDYITYFWTYWCAEILYVVLALLSLHEAFKKLFEPFIRSYSWFRLVFPVSVVVFATIPLFHALKEPLKNPWALVDFMLSVELGMGLLQCGLFAVFLLIKQVFRLRGRIYAWGIVEGFAATSLAGLTYGMRSEFGKAFFFVAKYAAPVGYILALVLWLDTFTRRERDIKWPFAIAPEQLRAEVNAYTMSLKKFLERRRS